MICEDFEPYKGLPVSLAYEYLDERGKVLARLERHASEC